MSTAEFHDDGLSDEGEGDDEDAVDLDELTDLDATPLDADDTPADDTGAEVDDDEDADEVEDAEEAADDDDDEAEASLDVLLAREKVLDEDDLGRVAEESRDGLNVRPALMGADEFTCRSCFLVKRRAQLADEKRLRCFDCV